jgi:hypothetical protein
MQNYNLNYFIGKNWSLVLMKDGKIIYRSKDQRLMPLVFCLKNYKKEMQGAAVYDKIIGRAAAMLLVYGKVKEVWTPTISEGGLEYLQKNKIKVIYRNKTENILNKKGDDLCPMEKMSKEGGLAGLLEVFELKNIFEPK